MISAKVLTDRLSQGTVDFTSSLVEQALWNDKLRPIVINELEKYLVAQVRELAEPGQPEQVTQDKADLAIGLVRGAERALERGQISRAVLRRMLKALLGNAALGQNDDMKAAWEGFAARHGGNEPPVTMLISPTKTCNLKCIGCYASCDPGERVPSLEWDVFDRIVTEAKTLWGMRFITISGGEPFTYSSQGRDFLSGAEKHDDCFFLVYTNGTLFTERVAERLAEAGNVVPAISVEGFEKLTDDRRGKGTFQRILKGMANLRQAGVPFGISLTGTCLNAEEILSEEFIEFMFDEQQAIFGWLFQYMPIGRAFTLELLVTPEQRAWMWKRSWEIVRDRKIMLADFWNFGTASDGCIAGAKPAGYLYIDWNGKVTPCVFVPYSPGNINEIYSNGGTLDDVYELPYMKAIRQWQLDYGFAKDTPQEVSNWLMPCPHRDHYGMHRQLVAKYKPEPEDKAAAQALEDGQFYEGMMAYNEEVHRLLDPIWEETYLKGGSGGDGADGR